MAQVKTKTKQKRSVINIATKQRIISEREKGERVKTLSKRYKLHTSTISNIWRKRESIRNKIYAEGTATVGYRKKRTAVTEQIEIELSKWLKEVKNRGEKVTSAQICEQARMFHQILMSAKGISGQSLSTINLIKF